MNKFDYILLVGILLSFTIAPEFGLISGIPEIKLVDALMPFLFYRLYTNRSKIQFPKFYMILGGYMAYILLTILINEHLKELNEYFELYKVFKFSVVIAYISTLDISFIKWKRYFFMPLFVLVFIFNALHYFNVFNFNDILEVYYNGGIHIKSFGLNSIGGEATKRLTGTIGNPNNNAILMLFFIFIFYPRNVEDKWADYLFFFLATFLFFLCQSRTGLIAFLAVMAIIIVLNLMQWRALKMKIKKSLVLLALCLVSYTISYMFSSNFQSSVYPPLTVSEKSTDTTEMQPNIKEIYLNTLFSKNVLDNTSIKGRFEVWEELWIEIKQKPILGHGPNKNYFYENEIYAESGFIQMAYRYGIVGLIFYIFGLLYLFLQGMKYREGEAGRLLWQVTVVIAVTSLTNIPFSSRELLVFFALIIGIHLNAKRKLLYGKNE